METLPECPYSPLSTTRLLFSWNGKQGTPSAYSFENYYTACLVSSDWNCKLHWIGYSYVQLRRVQRYLHEKFAFMNGSLNVAELLGKLYRRLERWVVRKKTIINFLILFEWSFTINYEDWMIWRTNWKFGGLSWCKRWRRRWFIKEFCSNGSFVEVDIHSVGVKMICIRFLENLNLHQGLILWIEIYLIQPLFLRNFRFYF